MKFCVFFSSQKQLPLTANLYSYNLCRKLFFSFPHFFMPSSPLEIGSRKMSYNVDDKSKLSCSYRAAKQTRVLCISVGGIVCQPAPCDFSAFRNFLLDFSCFCFPACSKWSIPFNSLTTDILVSQASRQFCWDVCSCQVHNDCQSPFLVWQQWETAFIQPAE